MPGGPWGVSCLTLLPTQPQQLSRELLKLLYYNKTTLPDGANRLIRPLSYILPTADPDEDDIFLATRKNRQPAFAYHRVFHSDKGLPKRVDVDTAFDSHTWNRFSNEDNLWQFTPFLFGSVEKRKFEEFYKKVLSDISDSVWANVFHLDSSLEQK